MATHRLEFVATDEGQDLIEYALLAALIALVVASGVAALGGSVASLWDGMATTISGWGS